MLIIDPGHGGVDGGAVSVNGVNESVINLDIAKKMELMCEFMGFPVLMTRESEELDYPDDCTTIAARKRHDQKSRVAFINAAENAVVLSIHQNSFQSSSVRGAQVFYYTGSEQGQQFAQIMQQQLVEILDPSNTRVCKENSSYYLLKKTSVPLVIVECGFLSNPEEAAMLQTEEFQDRTADAICMGIQKYLETCSDQTGSPEISGKAEQRVLEKY